MAGLAGSGHCLGMCGGIVAALAVARQQRLRRSALPVEPCLSYRSYHDLHLAGPAGRSRLPLALFTLLKPHLYRLFAAADIMVIIFGLATACGLRGLSLALLDGSGWGFMSRMLRRASLQAAPAAFLARGWSWD